MTTAIEIRRAATRFHTDLGWLDSWHCFSFGNHYDPTNIGHGLLIVSNDDVVAAGGGFGEHSHRDMEIVTWVLDGELEHRDSAGNDGLIYAGLAQRMSAGRGITHSEMNHSSTQPVHFVQMWVVPDVTGIEPEYEQLDVNAHLESGGLVPVASGQGHPRTITLHQAGAVMYVARVAAGDAFMLPSAPFVHLFVARGSVELDGNSLARGDSARSSDAGEVAVVAREVAEVIVWETHGKVER